MALLYRRDDQKRAEQPVPLTQQRPTHLGQYRAMRPCDGSPLGIWRVSGKNIAGYRNNCIRMKLRATGPVLVSSCSKNNQLNSWTWQAVR